MNAPRWWQTLLSYALPLTRRVPSAVSGMLEVTLTGGRKVLDSRSVNYSYGSLQRVLRYGLAQVPLARVQTVLLLGLGGGSVVQTLRQERGFRGAITAVEVDPVVIRLAQEEFGIGLEDVQLHIVCADAFVYLPQLHEPFDLIIIDVFIDLQLPPQVWAAPFWEQVRRLLAPGGWVVFNAISTPEPTVDGRPLLDYLANLGIQAAEHRVEELNRLYIGQVRPA